MVSAWNFRGGGCRIAPWRRVYVVSSDKKLCLTKVYKWVPGKHYETIWQYTDHERNMLWTI